MCNCNFPINWIVWVKKKFADSNNQANESGCIHESVLRHEKRMQKNIRWGVLITMDLECLIAWNKKQHSDKKYSV